MPTTFLCVCSGGSLPAASVRAASLETEILPNARAFEAIENDIAKLREELEMEEDVLLDPLHFIATTDSKRRSCSTAVWRGSKLIGVMYLVQEYVWGIKTGYALGGDYGGRGLLLCHAEDEAEVLKASIKHVMSRGVHAIHLRNLCRDDSRMTLRGISMRYLDALIPGDRMPLPADYKAFLASLGKHTRRNIRYYTRKVLDAGIEFVPFLTKDEYQQGVERLNTQSSFPARRSRLARDERLLALNQGTMRSGLRDSNGVLVAVVCGFAAGRRFHVLMQMNDAQLNRLSLSIVLRGYLADQLIAMRLDELQFMGGTSLSFGRFCVPQSYRSIFVDRDRGLWSWVKRFSSLIVRLMAQKNLTAPEALKMVCNSFLDERILAGRTALLPASVVFPQGLDSNEGAGAAHWRMEQVAW